MAKMNVSKNNYDLVEFVRIIEQKVSINSNGLP